jgi:hypothetical protein
MILGENLSSFNAGNFAQWLMGMALFIILVERALSQVFDTKLWKWVEVKWDEITKTDILDLKPWISAGLCVYLVFAMNIDFFAFLFQKSSVGASKIFTGLFVAGGSTGLLKALRRWSKLKTAINEAEVKKVKP